MNYLYETWYAAAWSNEITRTPLARTLLGEEILIYRTEDGRAVALRDRCPHRFAPLHKGTLFGDEIRCPYHGLRFDPAGKCVHNPVGSGHIPSDARVHAYPLQEQNGIIWLWFGDGPTDVHRIVRFDYFDQPDRFATVQGSITIDANYSLISDNLLDLSHGEFLHPMLAAPGSSSSLEYGVEQQGDTVIAKHLLAGVPTLALFKRGWKDDAPELCDTWSDVTWNAPSVLEVEVGVTRPGDDRKSGVLTLTAHLITPENENRSHYFWRLARNFATDDEALSQQLTEVVSQAFSTEDKPMIEAQHRYMHGLSMEQLSPVLLKSDGAGVRARRVLASLIDRNPKPNRPH